MEDIKVCFVISHIFWWKICFVEACHERVEHLTMIVHISSNAQIISYELVVPLLQSIHQQSPPETVLSSDEYADCTQLNTEDFECWEISLNLMNY